MEEGASVRLQREQQQCFIAVNRGRLDYSKPDQKDVVGKNCKGAEGKKRELEVGRLVLGDTLNIFTDLGVQDSVQITNSSDR